MTTDANNDSGQVPTAVEAVELRPTGAQLLGHSDLSFDARFDETFRAAYRAGYRLLGNREDARECAQEALSRAYPRWDRLATNGDPLPWVVRVAINLAIDRVRRNGNRTTSLARERTHSHERGNVSEAAETGLVDRLQLQAALRTLPRRQREVVALRFLADLSEHQVATALGISNGAVKQHTTRGLARLRIAMKDN